MFIQRQDARKLCLLSRWTHKILTNNSCCNVYHKWLPLLITTEIPHVRHYMDLDPGKQAFPTYYQMILIFILFSLYQFLNLHGNGLSRLQHVNCMTALKRLTVSFNELTRLDDISHMVRSTDLSQSAFVLSVLTRVRKLIKQCNDDVIYVPVPRTSCNFQ